MAAATSAAAPIGSARRHARTDDPYGKYEQRKGRESGGDGWTRETPLAHAPRARDADDDEHGVQQAGGDGSGKPRDVWRCQQREHGDQRGREQQREGGDDEDVDEESGCRDAMEVGSHGQRHDELDGGRDEAEIEEEQGPTNGKSKRVLRAAGAARTAADERLQVLAKQAECDAELGEARLECGVHADGVDEA